MANESHYDGASLEHYALQRIHIGWMHGMAMPVIYWMEDE